ncbi:uncharacterized protein LOC122486530 [Prionailurus bengalensis]|uniref:uncharacterized protein LOC122486530 n=1 Tax=Prionailurus bengalensis TaxID=37029 RepID=UPI001CA7F670|nr:uncharacterized protein LOC122486530 [Prionailurus bengalensis]
MLDAASGQAGVATGPGRGQGLLGAHSAPPPAPRGKSPLEQRVLCPHPHLAWGQALELPCPPLPRAPPPGAAGGRREVEWGTPAFVPVPALALTLRERQEQKENRASAQIRPAAAVAWRLLPWWPLHANEQPHCWAFAASASSLCGVPFLFPLPPAGSRPAGFDRGDPSPNCEVPSSGTTVGASRRRDTGLGQARWRPWACGSTSAAVQGGLPHWGPPPPLCSPKGQTRHPGLSRARVAGSPGPHAKGIRRVYLKGQPWDSGTLSQERKQRPTEDK